MTHISLSSPILRIFAALMAVLPFSAANTYAGETGLQCEGRLSYNDIEPLRYVAPSGSSGLLLDAKTTATLALHEQVTLFLDHRLRTVNPRDLFPEQLYPFENYVYGSMELIGPGTLILGGSHSLFRNAPSFPTPWYLSTARITPKMLSAAEGSWNLETEPVSVAAEAVYSHYQYTMQPANTTIDSTIAALPPYGTQQDADLWADLSVAAHVTEELSIEAGGLTKQDFNGYDGYTIYRGLLGVSGNHQFDRNRIKFEWAVAERFLDNAVMKQSGYATGLSTRVATRLVWRLKKTFYLKGGAQAEFAQNLHKLFFEAQLRKTWDNGASIDLGYVSTFGVLFPRYGLRLASKIVITPHLALAPVIEGYAALFNQSTYRYYRSNYDLEVLIPAGTRFEFFIGGGYRHYDRHPLFASRAMVYGGIRTW